MGCQAHTISSDSHSEERQEIILRDGDTIGGLIEARVIRIPPGANVHVSRDLTLRATDLIELRGSLLVDSPGTDDPPNAPDIGIQAGRTLTVRGPIEGGKGRSFVGQGEPAFEGSRGGDGSDIRLSAPDLLVAAPVRGGAGGTGGWSAKGGDGGTLFLEGEVLTKHGFSAAEFASQTEQTLYIGGAGGPGGLPSVLNPNGGAGGDGGGVNWMPFEEKLEQEDEP